MVSRTVIQGALHETTSDRRDGPGASSSNLYGLTKYIDRHASLERAKVLMLPMKGLDWTISGRKIHGGMLGRCPKGTFSSNADGSNSFFTHTPTGR